MGMYLNPGKKLYEEAVNSDIFVDKTAMILYLNTVVCTKQKYVSVSRPRRFGKTMAADMICAYYGKGADGRSLFEEMNIAKGHRHYEGKSVLNWDAYLEKFDAIRLTMTDFIGDAENVADMIENLTDEVTDELMEVYPDVRCGKRINLRIVLSKIYASTNRQFVFVIDEWDAIFREWKEDEAGQKMYLDFLRDLLKDRSYIALAYMTGILPIKKYGKHSALNMFTEYSMMSPRQLAPYTGFTEDEVRKLCSQYGREFEKVRDWYDGYVVSDIIPPDPNHKRQKETGLPLRAERYSLYNPLSVVESMITGKTENYWNKTETYTALGEYIKRNLDGLKDSVVLMMDKGRVRIDTSTYQNDMTTFTGKDDVLSLLVHLGYLGFDDESSEVFIPNREIREEFCTSTKSEEWIPAFRLYQASVELLNATWAEDEEKVARLLEDAHNRTGNMTYNDESALSYAIQLAYYAAQKYYTTILELDTGKGYADIIYLPTPQHPMIPALLIELKYNKDAETALSQIKRNKYPDRLEHYRGNILLVAINYDKDARNDAVGFKHHSCMIERA